MLNIKSDRVFYHFEEISKIPRGSGNEKAVSDYIAQWAKMQNLEVVQDAVSNLIIRKPAAEGYKNVEPVVLQAHMDMVCEKTAESTHNFEKDPIILEQDDDWLVSACGTSLGADNGIGVASAMAVLEDDSLLHPALEVIFTVEEETTFLGAERMSEKQFRGRRIINLDHADDRELITGSSGGTGISFFLPLEREKGIPVGCEAYKIKVCGLNGGHSGEDIHRGRGNAIALLTRLLNSMDGISLVNLKGGTNRLAIPREAEVVVLVEDFRGMQSHIEKMKETFRREYGTAAPNLDIVFEKTKPGIPLKLDEFQKLKNAILLFPNGIIDMTGEFEGVVESSCNLGEIVLGETGLEITAEARSLYVSKVESIRQQVKSLAAMSGAEVEFFSEYSPWEYKQESDLREKALENYRQMFGEEMKSVVLHAGLECGMFMKKDPSIDAIAIGPTCKYFHSPNERVSISSTRKFYQFLISLLEKLK